MKKNRIILIVLAVIVTAMLCGCGIKSDASFGTLPDGVYGYTYLEEGVGGPFYRTKSYLIHENSVGKYIKHSRTMSGKTYPVERLDALINNAPEHDREIFSQVIDYANTQFGKMFLLSSSVNHDSIVLFIDNTRYDIPKPEDYEYANWQISDEKITIFTCNSERSRICCLTLDISTGDVKNFEIEVKGKIYTGNMLLKDGVLYYYIHNDKEHYGLMAQPLESDESVKYEFKRRPISFHLLGDGNLLLTSCLDSKICVEQINSDGELVSENYIEFPDGLPIDNLSEDVNIYLYGNTLYGYRRAQNGRALFACDLGASTPHFFFDLSKIEKKSGIVSYTKFMIERDGQLFDMLPYIQNGETAENTELHQNSALQSTSLILPVADVSPQYAEAAQKILDSFYFVSDEISQSYFDLTWRELEKELDPKLSHMPDGSEDYSLLQQYCYEPNGIDTYFLGHDEAAEELRNGKSLPEVMVISKTAADKFYNTINQVRILYGTKEPAAVMGEAQYHQYTDDSKQIERLNSMYEWVAGPTTALFLDDDLMRMLEAEGFSLNNTQAMSVSIMAHSNGIYFTDGSIERYYPQEIGEYTPLLSVGKMYSIDVLTESLETISFADANSSIGITFDTQKQTTDPSSGSFSYDEERRIYTGFSRDRSRYYELPVDDKQDLSIYSADGELLFNSKSAPELDGLYFFSTDFFEDPRYIIANTSTTPSHAACTVIDTEKGEIVANIPGNNGIQRTRYGFALVQPELGGQFTRNRKTDYLAVSLSKNGEPEVTLIETPEKFLLSDLVVLHVNSEHPIYSVYDDDNAVRKFFIADNEEILAVTSIPDSERTLTQFYGYDSSSIFVPSADGKMLEWRGYGKETESYPFIYLDDPGYTDDTFSIPVPSSETAYNKRMANSDNTYEINCHVAMLLCDYLNNNLEKNIHGCAFVESGDGYGYMEGRIKEAPVVICVIEVIDRTAVEAVLAEYTGDMPQIELRYAKVS